MERQTGQAQFFLGEIQLAVHREDSPLRPAPGKASVLRSCTTRRASPPRLDGSLDILHEGASSNSPWPPAVVVLELYQAESIRGQANSFECIRVAMTRVKETRSVMPELSL